MSSALPVKKTFLLTFAVEGEVNFFFVLFSLVVSPS